MGGKRPDLLRLDTLLVRRGLAPSRAKARELVASGVVEVDGLVSTKPARRVRTSQALTLRSTERVWVGRGAHKLLGALDAFAVDPSGLVCADLGASTGGFTEVLLDRGAPRVFAVDVGRGQLAWKLRTDDRVVNLEGTNARHLDGLPEPVALVVGDLSFISLALILPAVARILATDGAGGEAVLLVKPQFEAGRAAVGKGGRVRSDADRDRAIAEVADAARDAGFEVLGGHDSDLPGAKAGNVEHFLHLAWPAGATPPPPEPRPPAPSA